MQDYLNIQKAITNLIELEQAGIMSKDTIETHLPKIFMKIYDCISNMMMSDPQNLMAKDTNHDNEQEISKMTVMVKVINEI